MSSPWIELLHIRHYGNQANDDAAAADAETPTEDDAEGTPQ